MRKDKPSTHTTDDMLPEYDFSAVQGVRGKHAEKLRYGYDIVIKGDDGTEIRYRTWTNPLSPMTLEDTCAAMAPKPDRFVVGLEVEHETNGQRYVLTPQYMPKKIVPELGEDIACSALRLLASGPVWTVTAIAIGSPKGWEIRRQE